MNTKLIKAMSLVGSLSILTGCVNAFPQNVTLPTNNSPAQLSGNTVNLTKEVQPQNVENPEISEEQMAQLSQAYLQLINELNSANEGDNILISPFSISMALGMTENGANGQTLSEMEQYANGGISSSELNSIMNTLSKNMTSSEDVDWNVANSIWFNDNGFLSIRDSFLQDVVTYYNPEVFKAPFSENTVDDINKWVNNETYGMIPEILDHIDPEVKMYLVNAIAFDGEWQVEYSEDQIYENIDFTNINGTTSQVTMLKSAEEKYFVLGNGQGFVKPYKGGEYSFVGILPDEGVTPEEYLNELAASGEDLSKAVREAEMANITVNIPEFSFDYFTELSGAYKKMGMVTPFAEGEADFSKMMGSGDNVDVNIWIGRILHKTHIDVDRKGTKAAAATVVEMKCEAVMETEPVEVKYINLDRPFVYAIVDNNTGMPLFLGCQNTME